jgi:hypothetical protein
MGDFTRIGETDTIRIICGLDDADIEIIYGSIVPKMMKDCDLVSDDGSINLQLLLMIGELALHGRLGETVNSPQEICKLCNAKAVRKHSQRIR